MQQLIRINEIKARGDRIGVSLKQLCHEAGRDPSTVYRWVNGETDPGFKAYSEACDALEKHLVEHERQVLQHLAELHPERAA